MKPVRFLLIILLLGTSLACRQEPPKPEPKGATGTTEAIEGTEGASYQEAHRPKFHFTPQANWMNDPNGMFYLDGEYHLSYQYYPDSTVWGPMHWGHAVSRDLVRWEHLPVALYPDSLGYIFSGGSVVDMGNTSGLGTVENPPVVAAFTHHDPEGEQAGRNDFQNQSIAFSLDKGRSWTKYEGNPVLKNASGIRDFRDPKIVWYEPEEKWVMALAVYDRVQFYGSPDLKTWTYLSEFGIPGDTRLWECPDLFPLKVESTGETKWVLIVSIQQEAPNGGTGTSYFVGDFDGTRYLADANQQKWLDWGTDNYAFVTWDHAPVPSTERLGIGWMSNWQYAQEVPTDAWRSAMTVPRVISLETAGEGYALRSLPVTSLEDLRKDHTALQNLTIEGEKTISGAFDPSQCELLLQTDLEATTAELFGITLSNGAGDRLILGMDPENNQLWVDRRQSGTSGFSEDFFRGPHAAPLDPGSGGPDLRILLDVSSIEVFTGDGLLNFTGIFFPSEPFDTLVFWSEGGQWVLPAAEVYALGSIWDKAR